MYVYMYIYLVIYRYISQRRIGTLECNPAYKGKQAPLIITVMAVDDVTVITVMSVAAVTVTTFKFMPGVTQEPPRSHPGATQEPRSHPGATQEPPRSHPGAIQEPQATTSGLISQINGAEQFCFSLAAPHSAAVVGIPYSAVVCDCCKLILL